MKIGHKLLIINKWGFWICKIITLFNSTSQQPNIDKIQLYPTDTNEAKYQLLINKQESSGLKYCKDSKAFIEYSNDMGDIYKNIGEYNPRKKQKILIAFDDILPDRLANKNLNSIVTQLFIRSRKLAFFLLLLHILFCCIKNILG